MATTSDPRRDRCPELGPDVVELLQGGVHGLPNGADPIEPEPRVDEIRLDPQPLQRIRLRPLEPPRQRSGVGVERGDLGRLPRRALYQKPNDAVPERPVFADQSLDRALSDPGVLVERVERNPCHLPRLRNRVAAQAGRIAAPNFEPDQWSQNNEHLASPFGG